MLQSRRQRLEFCVATSFANRLLNFMIILGIDPGSHNLGWGVVRRAGTAIEHMGSGVIRPRAGELPLRLKEIAEQIDEVLNKYRPQAGSIETIFHAKNSQSAIVLGQSRGVAIVGMARFGIPVFEYTAGQIKQAATGYGRADKEQVQTMMRLLLKLTGPLALDTTDALAAAFCHAQLNASPTGTWLANKMKEGA